MPRRLRETVFDRFSRTKVLFKSLGKGSFVVRREAMRGPDIPIDNFFVLWHDCRRAKEDIALFGNVAELAAEARRQYMDTTYDLVADVASVVTILNAIQAEIGTNILNLDARGLVRAPYARCTDLPPFFNQVTSTQYAQTALLLDSLRDAVTINAA